MSLGFVVAADDRRHADAMAHFDRGISDLSPLAEQFPRLPKYRAVLTKAMSARADLRARLAKPHAPRKIVRKHSGAQTSGDPSPRVAFRRLTQAPKLAPRTYSNTGCKLSAGQRRPAEQRIILASNAMRPARQSTARPY